MQEVVEGVDRDSVHRDDPIAGPQARLCRRPARHHLDAGGGEIGEPLRRVEQDDDEEGHQVVHARPGRDDEEPRPGGLVGVRAAVVRVLRGGIVGGEPGDLAIAAEREGAEPVVRLAAPEPGDARAEADRERLHPHPEETGEREVASFVGCDEQAQAYDGDENGNHAAAV